MQNRANVQIFVKQLLLLIVIPLIYFKYKYRNSSWISSYFLGCRSYIDYYGVRFDLSSLWAYKDSGLLFCCWYLSENCDLQFWCSPDVGKICKGRPWPLLKDWNFCSQRYARGIKIQEYHALSFVLGTFIFQLSCSSQNYC